MCYDRNNIILYSCKNLGAYIHFMLEMLFLKYLFIVNDWEFIILIYIFHNSNVH